MSTSSPSIYARELVARWAPRLARAGIETARLDAELLVAHVCGIDRSRILIDDPELGREQVREAERLLERRRGERAPVAYLIGERWFAGLNLNVNERVLVPRPETELLVELAAQHAPKGAAVIDVGTGSGAIAIALAKARPDLKITASDIDLDALGVAAVNAREHDVAADPGAQPAPGRIAFQHAPLLGPEWAGQVVVSNPPYVETTARGTLAPELAHEPGHALYAGEDGLDVIRDLVTECGARGVQLVLIEHGAGQGAAVRHLLSAAAYRQPDTVQDLAGLDRVTWAQR